MKQITSFSVDWYDCGLCCAFDKTHERTTIYLRKKLIKVEKFNGLDELLSKEEYIVGGSDINEFFSFVNKTDSNNEWEKDYVVHVCDGSRWIMRLRYSDKTVKTVEGTVEKPDKGREIVKMIKNMLSKQMCIEDPVLFGC